MKFKKTNLLLLFIRRGETIQRSVQASFDFRTEKKIFRKIVLPAIAKRMGQVLQILYSLSLLFSLCSGAEHRIRLADARQCDVITSSLCCLFDL